MAHNAAMKRVPPHNLQAEESVLGAMLLSRDAVAAVQELRLSADDFYKPSHGHVFNAIASLYDNGAPIDAVTTAEELRRQDLLEATGGPAALVSLQGATPATTNAARYAAIVQDHARLRRLIATALRIVDMGFDLPEDVDAAIDAAEQMMFDVAGDAVRDTMGWFGDELEAAADRLDELVAAGGCDIDGLPTGYYDLDRKLTGLQPSNLIVVGARPSQGKTSLALNLSVNVALEQQRPVLFCSLEMSKLELVRRMWSSEAMVDSTGIRKGRLSDRERSLLDVARGKLMPALVRLDDDAGTTVGQIRAKARRTAQRHGLGMVVVDYLQLMQTKGRVENRQVEVSQFSRGLKLLARELEVPVIALSQLSRNLENRADKHPQLSDLRESGSLEQDSDVVLFIHRPELYDTTNLDLAGKAEIIVAKNRNGPTGTVTLGFLSRYTKFTNLRTAGQAAS